MHYLEQVTRVVKMKLEERYYNNSQEMNIACWEVKDWEYTSKIEKLYPKNEQRLEYNNIMKHDNYYTVYLGFYAEINVGDNGFYELQIPIGCPLSKVTGKMFRLGNIDGYYFDLSHAKIMEVPMGPAFLVYNDTDQIITGKLFPIMYHIGRDLFEIKNRTPIERIDSLKPTIKIDILKSELLEAINIENSIINKSDMELISRKLDLDED